LSIGPGDEGKDSTDLSQNGGSMPDLQLAEIRFSASTDFARLIPPE
jgi:hypothetical protein